VTTILGRHAITADLDANLPSGAANLAAPRPGRSVWPCGLGQHGLVARTAVIRPVSLIQALAFGSIHPATFRMSL
jgi:hypothetical protein